MGNIDLGSLIYLGMLLAALSFWGFSHRGRMGRNLQYLGVWVLIFIGTVVVVGLWSDVTRTVQPRQAIASDGVIEFPRGPDGHYHVTLQVNNEPVRFVVDTGATGIVLTREDAERIGLQNQDLVFFGQAQTANGMVRTAPVTLDRIELGPFVDTRVPAAVNSGDLFQSLLGMSYLQRFERLEISNNRLILER
jgi:aspartyl protease family protein